MLLPNRVGNHTNTKFPWYTASRDFRSSSFSVRLGVPIIPERRIVQRRKHRYYHAITAALSYSTADFAQLFDYITNRWRFGDGGYTDRIRFTQNLGKTCACIHG